MTPRALITGITGQAGSYLTEFLLTRGYEVHGVVRRSSSFNRSRIEHLRADESIYEKRLFLHYADLTDATRLRRVVCDVKPHELYHLAGQSHVGLSFEIPESTCNETAGATLALLEICRDLDTPPRIYHASSSEIFGSPSESPQNESCAFRPINPYGCGKTFATNIVAVYREAHGLHACNGIAFNHESVRRADNFVTKKIATTAVRIAAGSGDVLELGNLNSARDWGYASEFVEGMWAALQTTQPSDYVFATGEATTVRDFASAAFSEAGAVIAFEGRGESEVARDISTGRIVLRVNQKFFRPVDSCRLVGDSSKARRDLDWIPKIVGVGVARAIVQELLN